MTIQAIQTEKAYHAQAQRTYMFRVPKGMSKQAVTDAITAEFKVTVLGVRITLRKGKATKFSRGKHAYPGTTYRQDKKIAYVTLKEGDKIKVFEEEAEDVKADDKVEKKAVIKADETQKAPKAGLFAKRRAGKRGGDK